MKMAKKEEDPLFVGITSGDDLRKNILECSKDILESLKDYERFRSKREEKLRLIQKLKDDLKQISRLVGKVKTSLPTVKETGIKKPVAKKAEKPIKKEIPIKVEKPREKTEIEKLEAELDDIEKKLRSLS